MNIMLLAVYIFLAVSAIAVIILFIGHANIQNRSKLSKTEQEEQDTLTEQESSDEHGYSTQQTQQYNPVQAQETAEQLQQQQMMPQQFEQTDDYTDDQTDDLADDQY